jgi:hypothetical protein
MELDDETSPSQKLVAASLRECTSKSRLVSNSSLLFLTSVTYNSQHDAVVRLSSYNISAQLARRPS